MADETLGKAIQELRSLSKSLNREWLQQFNFIENLEGEINRINAAKILQIQLFRPAGSFAEGRRADHPFPHRTGDLTEQHETCTGKKH
jgi:hypothetical protein